MARVLPEIENKPIIGRQLFDIVTSGMYDNPLMIYREYIQNSVDSIDLAIANGAIDHDAAQIFISLSGQDRSIVIQDNGQGLNNDTAHGILTNLGCSPKEGTNQRGFRGIGRLGGLAYCDELIFETRATGDDFISVVRWNRREFDAISGDNRKDITLTEMIQAVAELDYTEPTEETPAHFFRVTLKRVHRFHSDVLMNLKEVMDYLAHSAPVPYNKQTFTHADAIEAFLSVVHDYRFYEIRVNGKQVLRPYADEVKLSVNSSDYIKSIECIKFTDANSNIIALGWYAKTNFLATLPSVLNVKGIRIRQGNIEVGGQHFLDDKFSEPRFSGWQIGEIHVVGNSLKPNARRDGFEHTPNFERFLEQAHALGRHLSSICRKSSNKRIANAKVESSLVQLEKIVDNPLTYIDEGHFNEVINDARITLEQIEKLSIIGISEQLQVRLNALKSKLLDSNIKPQLLENVIDGRKLRSVDNKSLLKHVAKTIINNYSICKSPEEVLHYVLISFTKNGYQYIS